MATNGLRVSASDFQTCGAPGSIYGAGGTPVGGSNAGVAATGYGAGGSGAAVNGVGTNFAGGAGAPGLLILREYRSA